MLYYLKRNQTGWENNSRITFNNFKGYECNYQLFINKNNSWLNLPDLFKFKQLSGAFLIYTL